MDKDPYTTPQPTYISYLFVSSCKSLAGGIVFSGVWAFFLSNFQGGRGSGKEPLQCLLACSGYLSRTLTSIATSLYSILTAFLAFAITYSWSARTYIGVHVLTYYSYHLHMFADTGSGIQRWSQLQHHKRRHTRRREDRREKKEEAYIHTHVIIYIRIILWRRKNRNSSLDTLHDLVRMLVVTCWNQ